MIRENKSYKEQNLRQFIEILKNNNLVFDASFFDSTSTSLAQSSSQETFTRLIDNNDIQPLPSAAADEEGF